MWTRSSSLIKRTTIIAGFLALSSSALVGCGTSEEGSDASYWRYRKKPAATTPVVTTPVASDLITVKVGTCHDGDTCYVERLNAQGKPVEKLIIRMGGIDAPEVGDGGQPFGKEAKAMTNSLLRGKTVSLRALEQDPYKRTVGEFYINGELINVKLVEAGLAEHYKYGSKKLDHKRYATAENSAQNLQKGVWSLDDYETPYEFRQRVKNQAQ